MKFLKLINKNKEREPEAINALYCSEVDKKIRSKYSLSNELAILRKRDLEPEEFAKYNAYAEQCKEEIRKELGI